MSRGGARNLTPEQIAEILGSLVQPQDVEQVAQEFYTTMRAYRLRKDQARKGETPTVGTTLPQETPQTTAYYIVRSFLQTIRTQRIPTEDEFIQGWNLIGKPEEKLYREQYRQALIDLKLNDNKNKKKNPIDNSMKFWAYIGHGFFYGSIVLIILVILRKMWELTLDVTDAVRSYISEGLRRIYNFFLPPRYRYKFRLWGWKRQKRQGHGRIKSPEQEEEEKDQPSIKLKLDLGQGSESDRGTPVVQITTRVKRTSRRGRGSGMGSRRSLSNLPPPPPLPEGVRGGPLNRPDRGRGLEVVEEVVRPELNNPSE
jgi:hypothetical protein